jgi:hypothetical protein
MLAGDVHDLLALLRREPAPDVPCCQCDADRAKTSAEAGPHETILAQGLVFAPLVVAVLALVVVRPAVLVLLAAG